MINRLMKASNGFDSFKNQVWLETKKSLESEKVGYESIEVE
jgi:hypothetical protein